MSRVWTKQGAARSGRAPGGSTAMATLPLPQPQALDTWASWLWLPFRKRLRCGGWWLLLRAAWHLPAGATSSSSIFAAATLWAQSIIPTPFTSPGVEGTETKRWWLPARSVAPGREKEIRLVSCPYPSWTVGWTSKNILELAFCVQLCLWKAISCM